MDTVLPFGKHKGLKVSEVPMDYVRWLAENSYSQPVKAAAKERLASRPSASEPAISEAEMRRTRYFMSEKYKALQEAEKRERIMEGDESEILDRQRDEEIAAYEAANRISWTSDSGHEIVVRFCQNDRFDFFAITVDGQQSQAYEIVPFHNTKYPAIVAKVGNVGLNADRRDALLNMSR